MLAVLGTDLGRQRGEVGGLRDQDGDLSGRHLGDVAPPASITPLTCLPMRLAIWSVVQAFADGRASYRSGQSLHRL